MPILLSGPQAETLYQTVKDLPIVDFHCHLSPREIIKNKPYQNLTGLWLSADHYKWRLMRRCGISEDFITGGANEKQKFLSYAKAVGTAVGNPLKTWTQMELSAYFGIDRPLNESTAEAIWEETCAQLSQSPLTPKKLIARSNVAYIATTDDVAASLSGHEALAADKTLPPIRPTFRADNALLLLSADYLPYLETLEKASHTAISCLDDFKQALVSRLDDFAAHGCKFSDSGIAFFPKGGPNPQKAAAAFAARLEGRMPDEAAYDAFLFEMLVFLARAYASRGITMQLHVGVLRNVNSRLFSVLGPDAGGDCVGSPPSCAALAAFFDAVQNAGGLPNIILYPLDSSVYPAYGALCASFNLITLGAPWWFADHEEGMRALFRAVCQTDSLGALPGMVTDSRSFTSYVRHDYFRRVLASFAAGLGETDTGALQKVLWRVCYGNAAKLAGLCPIKA